MKRPCRRNVMTRVAANRRPDVSQEGAARASGATGAVTLIQCVRDLTPPLPARHPRTSRSYRARLVPRGELGDPLSRKLLLRARRSCRRGRPRSGP